MRTVAIVYFSGQEHTHLMAKAIGEGASKVPDTNVELLRITGEQIIDGRWQDDNIIAKLDNADAIVFGSPTYMGGVAAQYKAFLDNTGAWFEQKWKDKLAAGFTHSSSPSGDKQGTLLYLVTFAAQMSMIWISSGEMPSFFFGKDDGINRLGSFLGLMGQAQLDMSKNASEIDSGDRLSSVKFGLRIAEASQRWKSF
jgi:NAD(P)H dehydrogenase (quinone)